jgi:hypothetical protein
MKKILALAVLLSVAMLNIPSVMAQTVSSLNGQSMNGSTGLYSLPSGHIGWENSGNFGLDLGYRAIINNNEGIAHIPALTASLFRWVEISAVFDFQPVLNYDAGNHRNEDLIFGVKFRLPTNVSNSRNPSIAIGGNVQLINITNNGDYSYNAYQPYMAITYIGAFFNMSAQTTIVFGKTFYSGGPENNSDIDFGMGFDLILFPDVFRDAVHWIIDFANFSYSDNSWPNNVYYHTPALWRGILNTGFRIDLSAFPVFSRFKFLVDLVFNDLFDAGGRSFTVGTVFGFSVP